MTAPRRWRDVFPAWFPNWLSQGDTVEGRLAYRVLWVLHATIDKLVEGMTQAFMMALPGYGSPSALPLIGLSRGLLRGQSDSPADFAARLRAWRSKWLLAGTRVGLGTALHEYLLGRPQVDVVNRAGSWTRVNADGSVTQFRGVAWNWDGTSNPERAGGWSDLWIIIRTPYRQRSVTIQSNFQSLPLLARQQTGIGMYIPPSDVADMKSIVGAWKSAGSRVRAVVFCSDPTLFNPTIPSTLPDGTWGDWHVKAGDGGYIAGNRNKTSCRYWEPN